MQSWKVENGPRRASWGEIVGMDMSDPLLMLIHVGNHGATGPKHDPQAANIRELIQCYCSDNGVLLCSPEQYRK